MKGKNILKSLAAMSALMFTMSAFGSPAVSLMSDIAPATVVRAVDLDDMDSGGPTTGNTLVPQDDIENFKNQAQAAMDALKPTEEDFAKAVKKTSKLVGIVRLLIAFGEILLFVIISFVTVVDLLCLAYRPAHDVILKTSSGGGQSAGGGMPGGMMPGMAGGNPGGGLTGFQKFLSYITMHCSTTCVNVIKECTPGQSGGGGGMPMGGMPMMGGMGGMGGMGTSEPAAPKNLWITYMKRKPVELIGSAFCLVLFVSTAFTNFGILLATKVLELLNGINL